MKERPAEELEATLASLVPEIEDIRRLLYIAGVGLEGLVLSENPKQAWAEALDHCRQQGRDAQESLLVELLERHPGHPRIRGALRELTDTSGSQPKAAPDGVSLKEAIVRDPIEGTELLIAFAEALGKEGIVLLQARRCYAVLEDIAESRKRHGQTMRHERKWKQIVHQVLDLADEILA